MINQECVNVESLQCLGACRVVLHVFVSYGRCYVNAPHCRLQRFWFM